MGTNYEMDDEFMGEQRHSRDSGEDNSTCMIESNQFPYLDPMLHIPTVQNDVIDDSPLPPLSQEKMDENCGTLSQSEDPEYFRTTLSQQFRDPCSDIPEIPQLSQDPKYNSNYGGHPQTNTATADDVDFCIPNVSHGLL